MSNKEWLVPYEKPIMLNAIYDTLDRLSFVIDKADSIRGILFVSSAAFPQVRGQIKISPYLSGNQTLVKISTNSGSEKNMEWIDALMDEAQSLIHQAEMGDEK